MPAKLVPCACQWGPELGKAKLVKLNMLHPGKIQAETSYRCEDIQQTSTRKGQQPVFRRRAKAKLMLEAQDDQDDCLLAHVSQSATPIQNVK